MHEMTVFRRFTGFGGSITHGLPTTSTLYGTSLPVRPDWIQFKCSHTFTSSRGNLNKILRYHGCHPSSLSLLVGMHTSCKVQGAGEKAKAKKPSGSGREHGGSVLAQFARKTEEPKQVTVATKVVQAGKDMSYLVVILAGFALTGFLFWSVGSEFFSKNSPSAIFTQALKRVKKDPQVAELLGTPITGHGESSGRGRRRHIPHQEYIVDDVTYMRLKFHVDGTKRKGIASIDLKKNDRGKYECRFLMVELQGAPGGTIVVEDNR